MEIGIAIGEEGSEIESGKGQAKLIVDNKIGTEEQNPLIEVATTCTKNQVAPDPIEKLIDDTIDDSKPKDNPIQKIRGQKCPPNNVDEHSEIYGPSVFSERKVVCSIEIIDNVKEIRKV